MAGKALSAALPGAGRSRAGFSPVWLSVPALLFLGLLMFVPMAQILSLSVWDSSGFTWKYLAKATSPGLYARVLGNTFHVALMVTLWCIALGYPLAFWLAGLQGRAQRIAIFCILLPFWTSPLIKNFTWMVLLGRNGIFAQTFSLLGFEQPPELLYSGGTVIFALAHTMMPLAVITMLPVIRDIDRRLPSAALTLGASGPQSFWMVVLPLSMRGISSAALLVFVGSLGSFITSQLIGGPKQTMIGQLIIAQINQLQNWSQGAALALVLLAAVLAAIFVFDRLFGITTVSGSARQRGPESRLRRLGLGLAAGCAALSQRLGGGLPRGWGRRALNLYAGVVIFVMVLPVLAFVPMAFSGTAELAFPPRGFSFMWFGELFRSDIWVSAMLRSVIIGLGAAALVLVVTGLAAAGLSRSSSRFSGLIFMLMLSPMIIPTIVIAVSMFYLFADLGLVASNTGIMLGHCVVAMPVVFVILLTTFKGYNWKLNDVAATLGASRLQGWRIVTLPLMKGGLAAGFVTGFLQSFEELTIALFIGGGLKTTLPRQMWDSILLQATPVIAAASVVMLAIVLFFFILMEMAQSRQGVSGSGRS